jgi:hypothetical protein
MLVNVNFGGFYESLHDYYVESAVANHFGYFLEDGEIDQEAMWYLDTTIWSWARERYSEEYIDELNYILGTDIKFGELDSPSAYNYRTDVIIADISRRDILKIIRHIKNNDLKQQVFKHIRANSTPYDGYMAYYDYAEYFQKENRQFLVEIMLDVIIKEVEPIVEDFEIVGMPEVVKDSKYEDYYTLKNN